MVNVCQTVTNLSETEPLVMLKHFAPENPDTPPGGPLSGLGAAGTVTGSDNDGGTA